MIRSKKGNFIDEDNRILILRGCNFSADTKIPVIPDGSTHNKDSLKIGNISFVNRPCPLNQADEHFERMKRWGFKILRFLVTWEAIEPNEPGKYDKEYLSYVKAILKKAEDYGFYIYIDPHQDVFSRFSGGDGAPWWTFDAIGIDIDKINITGAAYLHKDNLKNFPPMTWPTNYNRYAAATMFTLFFAGNDFAKSTKVGDENIQDWLQNRYIAAIKTLANEVKENKAIIGFGSMNEPHNGYIEYSNLDKLENCSYAKGAIPTGFQSMLLASGFSQMVNIYNEGFFGRKPIGKILQNKDGVSLFKEKFQCPWRKEGVWDIVNNKAALMKKDYFSNINGRKVNFSNDYLKPFILKFQKAINEINPDWFTIVEGLPQGQVSNFNEEESKKMIHGFHWYDGMIMVLKLFSPFFSIRSDTRKPVFGKKNIIESYYEQILKMKENTRLNMGNMPCLLGEFGLAFDIFKKRSFNTGNFNSQNTAISMFHDAIDKAMISSTIWTYTVNNNHKYGDNWNTEDFSIFSMEDDENKRAVSGFLRPYPMVINGNPISYFYNRKNKQFILVFDNKDYDFDLKKSTIIFIPEFVYKKGIKYKIHIDDKFYEDKVIDKIKNQQMDVVVGKRGIVKIIIDSL